MPIQAPQWTDYLNCPVCCREFGAPARSPISLACGHTLCKHCLKHLHRKQCPFDQTTIQAEPEELVVNTALLQLAGYAPPAQPYHPPCIQALPEADRQAYDNIVRCMEQLAVYLKFCGNANNSITGNRLSRPMQRKLVSLLQCAVTDEEGRGRAARAARSLGERTVIELILQHQNSQQLSANLWAAVRARGCQFLGPAMQEEVLKLVLLALEDGSALSRKVLVMFVVQRLEPHFPQASKTSIGHVVQLLYRASCFKVSKRECDSSLMQLKEEFRSYESLRREHDAQIVQIATEAGLRIAPDQWSSLLYGDTAHKSHMQSIIDKLQTPQSFTQSVQELFVALQRTGDPTQLVVMSINLERLACIDVSPEARSPTWQQLSEMMASVRDVVGRLVHFQQNTGRDANHNQKSNHDRSNEPSTSQPSPATMSTPTHNKYKASNRDSNRVYGPRGVSKNYTHSEEDSDRYRSVMNNSNSNSNVTVPNPAPLNGNYQFVPAMPVPKMPVPVMVDPMYTAPYMHPVDKYSVPQPMNPLPLSPAGMPPYMLPQDFSPDNSHAVDNNFPPAMVRQMPVSQNGMLLVDRYYGRYGPSLEEAMYAPRTSPYPTEFPPRSPPYPQEFRPQSPSYPPEFRPRSPQYNQEFRPQSPAYNEGRTRSPYPPPEYNGPVYQQINAAGAMYQNPEPSSSQPMPNIYVTIPVDQSRNISPYQFDDLQIEVMPEYRLQNTFQTAPIDRSADPTWTSRTSNDTFNVDEMRNSLPHCSTSTDDMFKVGGDRRAVGAQRLVGTRPSFLSNRAYDKELEEELQKLERRIDTEFEYTD